MTVPPAVAAYRAAAFRFPPKVTYDEIAATVGEDSEALARWQQVVREYVSHGGNPSNAATCLDRFRANGKPRADAIAAAADKWRRK